MNHMKIERAGLIPFYITDDGQYEMMFMLPSDPMYGGSEFQIAKGKIEIGESELETAIRESSEELGLRYTNLSDTLYCGKFLGRTHIFAGIVTSKEDFGDFDFETSAVMWMSPNKFDEIGRELHKDVVKCAIDVINDHRGLG